MNCTNHQCNYPLKKEWRLCPICGTVNFQCEDKFFPSAGDTIYHECNHPLEKGWRFCPKCETLNFFPFIYLIDEFVSPTVKPQDTT